jgi:hypothetical protein
MTNALEKELEGFQGLLFLLVTMAIMVQNIHVLLVVQ